MSKDKKRIRTVLCLLLLSVFTFFLCVGIGTVTIPFGDIMDVLSHKGKTEYESIIMHIRLPRTAACALAGAGLSMAGVVIQNVLQNPLAGPNIIGVNAGAGLAVVLCSALAPISYSAVPLAAFLGALLATMFVYFLAKKTGASKVTLVLAGVCVNSFLNAAADVVHTLEEDTLTGTYGFRLGGFTSVSVKILIPAGILIILSMTVVLLLGNELEILSLGEQIASSIGLNTRFFQLLFLVLASVLAGAAVSFAGLLGFVGLVAPHISRRIAGEECRYLLPVSALFGAFFVMVCDLAARTLWAPYEIPTGILLSGIGAPFFLYLLFHQKRRRSHD